MFGKNRQWICEFDFINRRIVNIVAIILVSSSFIISKAYSSDETVIEGIVKGGHIGQTIYATVFKCGVPVLFGERRSDGSFNITNPVSNIDESGKFYLEIPTKYFIKNPYIGVRSERFDQDSNQLRFGLVILQDGIPVELVKKDQEMIDIIQRNNQILELELHPEGAGLFATSDDEGNLRAGGGALIMDRRC